MVQDICNDPTSSPKFAYCTKNGGQVLWPYLLMGLFWISITTIYRLRTFEVAFSWTAHSFDTHLNRRISYATRQICIYCYSVKSIIIMNFGLHIATTRDLSLSAACVSNHCKDVF
jgi:hypothetical protein